MVDRYIVIITLRRFAIVDIENQTIVGEFSDHRITSGICEALNRKSISFPEVEFQWKSKSLDDKNE